MGLFSSVIHVYKRDQSAVVSSIRNVVDKWEWSLKVPTGPCWTKGDVQLLYLVGKQEGEWSTVIQTHGSRAESPHLSDLARQLSLDLQTFTLAMMVHDSDLTFYNLYSSGGALDGYNSCPQYFEKAPLPPAKIKQQQHSVRPFAPLLPKGVSIADLKNVLDRGWWKAFDAGKLGENGLPKTVDGYVLEDDRMIAIGNLLQLHGEMGTYPFAGWADNKEIIWPNFVALEGRKG